MKTVLSRIFAVPGAARIYWAVNRMLRRTPRFDTAWRHLPRWEAELESAGLARTADPPRRRLLVFAVLPFWVDYMAAIALLLAARGYRVDLVWLPHAFPRPSGDSVGHRAWLRWARAARETYLGGRLRIRELASSAESSDPVLIALSEEQAHLDTSYLNLKERVDPLADPQDRLVFEHRRGRALSCLSALDRLLSAESYDRALVPNGVVLEFGAVYRYLRGQDIPVSTIEGFGSADRVIISRDEPANLLNTDREWSADSPHEMDAARYRRFSERMRTRMGAGVSKGEWTYQRADPEDGAVLRARLGLQEGRPLVLVCPNVPFDATFYLQRPKVFHKMHEWLWETVAFLGERPHADAVIRAHPAESLYFGAAPETTRSLLEERFPRLPSNVRLIGSEEDVNTYSLMQIADLGAVYASTTGMEMAALGVPVLAGAPDQHYNNRGFTLDPSSRDEYFQWLGEAVDDPAAFRLSERQKELAVCYMDVFFHKWPRAFPWVLATFFDDIRAMPPAEVMAAGAPFDRTLEELAGS